jgi:CHAD domain-containing protein
MGLMREDEIVPAAIVRRVGQLGRHVDAARVDLDPESVHQARVAVRRLRSHFRTFREFLDAPGIDELDRELCALGASLGEVRDLDVLLEMLGEAGADTQLVAFFEARRHCAGGTLRAVLGEAGTAALLERLAVLAADAALVPRPDEITRERLAALVERRWHALDKAMRSLGPDPSDEELHRARIRAKRCRYAIEDVAPAFAGAHRLAKALTSLQDALGRLHDTAVVTERLREAARVEPQLGFAAGELAGRLQARAAHDGEWQRAWKRASKPKLRSWL